MKFNKINFYINEKIKDLNLPYFECIVTKNNKVIFNYNFAKQDKENHLLRMYSMSKPITVVGFMQLVNKGLVDVNDNVSKYLEGFDNLFIINSNSKIKTPIKIHHLLSMTSGLDYNLTRPSIIQLKENKKDASTIELASRFAKDGIGFEPGGSFQYSLSIDVVAAIIEKVSGLMFSDYINQYIFEPLGMKKSTFKNNIEISNRARNDYEIINGEPCVAKPLYEYFLINNVYESGGAGLLSTVSDYSLFASSLANNEIILPESFIKKIAKVYVSNTCFGKETSEYSKSSDEYGYGYGVRVRKHCSKCGIPIGEFGWDGAAGSYSLIDRKNKISIVIGLTIFGWPTYVKNLQIELANLIYEEIFKPEKNK